MKKLTEIPITCKGQKYIPIQNLQDFQGNLKELSIVQFEKLKESILKHGFSFPVFVWNNSILDGHQRIFVVNDLLKNGYSIGKIPCVEIEAKDKKEAAEKLLFLNSRYAKITEDGLIGFIDEVGIDDSILKNMDFADVDFDEMMQRQFLTSLSDIGFDKELSEIEKDDKNIGKKRKITAILFSAESVGIYENAIKATGKANRSEAIVEICKFFIEKNEKR